VNLVRWAPRFPVASVVPDNDREVAVNTAECPECGGTITFKTAPVLHELVRCADCGAELEATALDPTALALAPTEEEDWGE
jgi:alpha-aminoadipate/glutamate carrier protein LysW